MWTEQGKGVTMMISSIYSRSHLVVQGSSMFSVPKNSRKQKMFVWFLTINLTVLSSRGYVCCYRGHYNSIIHILYIYIIYYNLFVKSLLPEPCLFGLLCFVASCVLFIPFCCRRHQMWCQPLGPGTPKIPQKLTSENLQKKYIDEGLRH